MNFKLNTKRKITRKVCGQDVVVVPYINSAKKKFIIEKLISYYNESSGLGEEYSEIVCELRANYDVLVLGLNTDVGVSTEDSYEDMVSSGLIDELRRSVFNYDEVFNDAMLVVSMLKMETILPSVDSFDNIFGGLTDAMENMDDNQKNNLEIFVKAAMANSANTAIMQAAKTEQ
jgi:hypothetical protein